VVGAVVTISTERVLLTVLVLVAVVFALVLMRRGWVARARRQFDVAALPRVPGVPAERAPADVTSVPARYLGANRSGDWLDRVVVHGLGAPSAAQVSVRCLGPLAGVWVVREGAPDIYVPAAQVRGARHDRAGAGRATESDALVVIEWSHESVPLELVLRIRDADRAEHVRAAAAALALASPTGGRP
jgi:hypothetical protein